MGDGTVAELELLQVRPVSGTTPIAALYLPLGPCDGSVACPSATLEVPQPWEAGRVVFRYEDIGAARVSWFAADIVVIPALEPPEASPALAR